MRTPRRRFTGGAWLWLASAAAQAALLGVLWATGLLSSSISINPAELERRAEQVAERSRELDEQLREARKDVRVPEEHKDRLREEVQRTEREAVREKIERMKRSQQEIEQDRQEAFERIERRTEEQLRAKQVERLLERVVRADEDVSTFERNNNQQETREAGEQLKQEVRELREKVAQLKAGQGDEKTLGKQIAEEAKRLSEKMKEIKETADESDSWKQRQRAREAKAAMDMLADVAKQFDPDSPSIEEMNDTSTAQGQTPELLEEQLASTQEQSLGELYETAKSLESDIARKFEDVKAAELAQMQGESFAEAREKVRSSQPSRPDLAEALDGQGPETVGELNEMRDAAEQAVQQAESMRASAESMQRQASGMGQPNTRDAQARLAQQLAMRRAAMAEGNRSHADMSAFMRALASGQNVGPSSARETGFRAGDRRGDGGEFMEASGTRPDLRLDFDRVKQQALPGRMFSADSDRAGWMFLDTWYVIGPWENGGRIDFSNTHPPEWEIDLDARYADGKAGRDLEWQFTQAELIRLTPPDEDGNSTYYAFTEVYFDEPSEKLLALSTDDAARVWINGVMVWEDHGRSPWQIVEGTRRVFFKRGYNTILLRIENGPSVCRFSILLCPPDALSPGS